LLTTFWTLTFEFGFSFILLFCTLLLQVFFNEKHTQGEKLFIHLCLTILCFVSLTLGFGSILFFQFFCFAPCCSKFLLIEGTHKATRVQKEKQSTFLLLATLCLGSLTLEFGPTSFFEFFCFAPCLNHLSWFKILGKLIHDSTL
jgi:hypothetical protein